MAGFKLLKVVLDSDGIKSLLKSQGVMDCIETHADRIAKSCGSGYEVSTFTGFDRAHAVIKADTWEARADNRKNNTLLRNIGR